MPRGTCEVRCEFGMRQPAIESQGEGLFLSRVQRLDTAFDGAGIGAGNEHFERGGAVIAQHHAFVLVVDRHRVQLTTP